MFACLNRCDHETTLCVWSIARRDFDPGNPHKRLPARKLLYSDFPPPPRKLAVVQSMTTVAVAGASTAAATSTASFSRFDAPCCLTVVRFHPRDPSLVLAGGFTGELFLWSVAREEAADAIVASTNLQGHREKVNPKQFRRSVVLQRWQRS